MRRREFLSWAAACGLASRASSARERQPIRLSSFDPQVKPIVASMTLEEKLGQMTQAELNNLKDEQDISRLFLGSVLSGGDADPKEGNGLVAWTDTVDRLISISQTTRLRIPILYGVDAVHGHNNVLGATVFPHNVALGCTNNPALVEEVSRITALEIRATGIRWTFAPCVAVPLDVRWGRTYEGFSEDSQIVSRLGVAAVRGLQAPELTSSQSVLACAKHYVGDGGTTYQPRQMGQRTLYLDQGDTQVDEATLRRLHLPGYVAAVKAGVGSIMVSYSMWNGLRVSGSRRLLTEILKDELGFEGFLISDYYAISQIDKDYRVAVGKAINAGMDMAMEPARYGTFIETLKALVADGTVPMARIDDAVTRILRVKWAMGLMDPRRPQLADRRLHKSFGSAAHRKVARHAVRESLVLLKNERNTLPIASRAKHIHIAGRAADDLGMQCGGWTVKWQGEAGNVTPGGTTIRAAVEQSVSSRTRVTFSADDAAAAAGADVAIVVVGEMPYAEGVGDRSDLSLSEADLTLIDKVAATGAPLVLVVISGRPLILGRALDEASAVVAAWLPGTEGGGVSDVLLGKRAPTGRLGFTWPRSVDQLHSNPLFPLAFGLKY
jgi:beta-glucosidase